MSIPTYGAIRKPVERTTASSLPFSQNVELFRSGLGFVKTGTEPSGDGPLRYVQPTPVGMQDALISKPFGSPEFRCSVLDTQVCVYAGSQLC